MLRDWPFGRLGKQRNFAMGAATEAAPDISIVDPLNDVDTPQLIALLRKIAAMASCLCCDECVAANPPVQRRGADQRNGIQYRST